MGLIKLMLLLEVLKSVANLQKDHYKINGWIIFCICLFQKVELLKVLSFTITLPYLELNKSHLLLTLTKLTQ